MKKQLNKLRRFFARTGGKKLNAATARDAASASYEDEDNSSRLSGAFIVVLVLHVIALVGVFFYSRAINRDPVTPPGGRQASSTLAPAATDRGQASTPAAPRPAQTPAPAPTVAQASERPSAPTPGPLPPKSFGSTYTVKSGDNITMIATVLGVKVADLKAVNELKSDDIRIGQELKIPEAKLVKNTPEVRNAPKLTEIKAMPPEKATAPGFYSVKKGDTLVGIARAHNVSYEELSKVNKISDPKKIQLNQKLKIPGKK